MESKQSTNKIEKKTSIPIRLVMLIPLGPSVFLLLSIFSGVGWGMLFIALLHLITSSIPLSSRLGRFMLGANDYDLHKNRLIKTRNSIIYKISYIIVNLLLFYFTYALFRMNIRIMDYL